MSSPYKTSIRLGHRLQTVCAILLLSVFLAGCGDVRGQKGGGNTLTLAAQGARYIALQDGLGQWQLLSAGPGDELVRVTLSDPQGRYGLMSVCLEEVSGALKVNVLHGVIPKAKSAAVSVTTTTDSTSAQALPLVTLPCASETETPGTPLEVRGQVRGLGAGEYGRVYLGGASSLIDAATPEHRLALRSESVPAEIDLVATKYGADAQLPSALLLEPVLVLSPERPAQADLDFTVAIMPQVAQLPLAGAHAGELLSGSIELVTKTGTRALLGEFTGEGTLSYARPPEALLRGASLWAEAQSFAYNDRTKAGSSRSASRTFEDGIVAPLVLPPPLELKAPALLGGAAQLRPQVTWRAKPTEAGLYTQFYSQIQEGHNVSYRLTQSLAYLHLVSPKAESFSQALPDFSALPEWQAAWNLVRGPELFWDVSWSRKTERDTLFSSRSGVLASREKR